MDNLVKRADILYAQKNYAQAEKTIREYIQTNPEDGEQIAFLGQILFWQYKNDEGLQCALSAVKLQPDKPYSYYVLSLIHLYGFKNFAEAEACIKKAIELAPEWPAYFSLYACVKVDKYCFVVNDKSFLYEALKLVERGLEIDPVHRDCLITKAYVLLNVGRYDEVNKIAEELLRRDAEDFDAFSIKGLVAMFGDKPSDAPDFSVESLRLDCSSKKNKQHLLESYFRRRGLGDFFAFSAARFKITLFSLMFAEFLITGFLSWIQYDVVNRNNTSNAVNDLSMNKIFGLGCLAVITAICVLICYCSRLYVFCLKYGKITRHLFSRRLAWRASIGIALVVLSAGQLALFFATWGDYPVLAFIGPLLLLMPLDDIFLRAEKIDFRAGILLAFAVWYVCAVLGILLAPSFGNGPLLLFCISVCIYSVVLMLKK